MSPDSPSAELSVVCHSPTCLKDPWNHRGKQTFLLTSSHGHRSPHPRQYRVWESLSLIPIETFSLPSTLQQTPIPKRKSKRLQRGLLQAQETLVPPPTASLPPLSPPPQSSGINTSWNIKCFYKKGKKILLTSLTRSFDGRISCCIHNHSPTLLLPEREPRGSTVQPSNPLKNETGFHPYLLQCQFQIIWTHTLCYIKSKGSKAAFGWENDRKEKAKKKKKAKKRKKEKNRKNRKMQKPTKTRVKQNQKTKKNSPAPSSYPERKSKGKRSPGPGASSAAGFLHLWACRIELKISAI